MLSFSSNLTQVGLHYVSDQGVVLHTTTPCSYSRSVLSWLFPNCKYKFQQSHCQFALIREDGFFCIFFNFMFFIASDREKNFIHKLVELFFWKWGHKTVKYQFRKSLANSQMVYLAKATNWDIRPFVTYVI